MVTVQWEGMGDVGSARYEPALLPPYPTIWDLCYSNCQRSTHSISKWIFRNSIQLIWRSLQFLKAPWWPFQPCIFKCLTDSLTNDLSHYAPLTCKHPIIKRVNKMLNHLVEQLGIHSTVVEPATHMWVYAGSSPTSADHRKELISASSCSLNDVK